jgi:hypothetical protein
MEEYGLKVSREKEVSLFLHYLYNKLIIMQKKNLWNKIGPVLCLFLLSPVIAELLSGSTPLSRGEQLIFESIFYGPAALLIREFVRRRQLGWFSVILLGFAFGIIEECLLLQSAFNPHFLNFDISYGRVWGVNWAWSEIIIINHSFWSITIPVFIAETIFPGRRTEPWLNQWGIGIFAVLLLLSSYGFYTTFIKMSGFTTSWIHYTIAGLLASGVILIAANLRDKQIVKFPVKTPPAWVTGFISFLVSLFWLNLLSQVFQKEHGVPAMFVELTGLIVLVVWLVIILGWINSKWNNTYRFSLAAGALYAGMVFGLIILLPTKNSLDIVGQICFILIVSVLLIFRRKRL